MSVPDSAFDALQARMAALELELEEARETLDAIRNGEVDAVVVGGPDGQIVYTLENADRPYRVLVEQMREGAATLGAKGTILYCNRSFAELLGERASEIVGELIFDFIAEQAILERLLEETSSQGRSTELTLLSPIGDPIPVNLSIVELATEDGVERMLCVIVTDLRENYERAREMSEARQLLAVEAFDRNRAEQSLAIALDAAGMGSWDLDLATCSILRSPRHDAIYGYEPPLADWSLSRALEHVAEEDRGAVTRALRTAERTGVLDLEQRIKRADGAVRWIAVRGRTFYSNGKPERIAGIIADNTERRLIDEQLRQGQKMEAIGQLTGGIAHDFNNLLMIIGGSLEALSRRAQLDDRAQKLLDAARIGVSRGAKLNEQLLAFARRQDMREDVLCLTDLLPTFETLLDRALGEAVSLEIKPQKELWWCKTDPHQLETAILNLAINARDAMEENGAITISTGNVSISPELAGRMDAVAGDYVVTAVTDTGRGLEPEIAARVFEPFFTTKELGKGTGLGLSQVYGFARQSGGFVTFESVVDQGTTVSIYLPRAEPVNSEPASIRRPDLEKPSDGTVLLVEDDPDVQAAALAMLEELGFLVIAASSGKEALAILGEGTAVDVVFTDVIMASGMTGIELARAIKIRHPDLPVLLTSGYTAQRMIPTAMNGDLPLLRKPYTLSQLSLALEAARDL